MSTPNFLGVLSRRQSEVLGQIGDALGRVKRLRGLTAEDMRVVFGLKVDDQVARYIAGEAEMGLVAWLRAVEAWPEIIELLNETENERVLKGRQLELGVDAPARRKAA